MQSLRIALFLLATVVIVSCQSPLNVSTDYDDTVDFTRLVTFRWHVDNQHNLSSKSYLKNDLVDQRIRLNVEDQLSAKGFRELEGNGKVDFLVNYSIMVEDKTDIRSYNTYNGYAPGFTYGLGYGSYGSSMGLNYSSGTNTHVINYKQGTLVIDILIPVTDKLIWRGSGDGRLPKEQTREERDQMVQEAVAEILKDFPPQRQ